MGVAAGHRRTGHCDYDGAASGGTQGSNAPCSHSCAQTLHNRDTRDSLFGVLQKLTEKMLTLALSRRWVIFISSSKEAAKDLTGLEADVAGGLRCPQASSRWRTRCLEWTGRGCPLGVRFPSEKQSTRRQSCEGNRAPCRPVRRPSGDCTRASFCGRCALLFPEGGEAMNGSKESVQS